MIVVKNLCIPIGKQLHREREEDKETEFSRWERILIYTQKFCVHIRYENNYGYVFKERYKEKLPRVTIG